MNTLEVLKRLIGTKTIWGVAILLINSTILKHAPIGEAVGDQIAQSLTGLLDAIGTALAVWGRLTAKEPILVNSVK